MHDRLPDGLLRKRRQVLLRTAHAACVPQCPQRDALERQVEVCTLFRAVHALWAAAGQYAELCVEDVKDELFDIVRPAHPLRITAADLLARPHRCRRAVLRNLKNPNIKPRSGLFCLQALAWSA